MRETTHWKKKVWHLQTIDNRRINQILSHLGGNLEPKEKTNAKINYSPANSARSYSPTAFVWKILIEADWWASWMEEKPITENWVDQLAGLGSFIREA